MQLESNSGEYSTKSYETRDGAPSTGGRIRGELSLQFLELKCFGSWQLGFSRSRLGNSF